MVHLDIGGLFIKNLMYPGMIAIPGMSINRFSWPVTIIPMQPVKARIRVNVL